MKDYYGWLKEQELQKKNEKVSLREEKKKKNKKRRNKKKEGK